MFYGKFKVIWFEGTSNKAYLFVLVGIIAFYTGSLLAIKMKIKISTMKKKVLYF